MMVAYSVFPKDPSFSGWMVCACVSPQNGPRSGHQPVNVMHGGECGCQRSNLSHSCLPKAGPLRIRRHPKEWQCVQSQKRQNGLCFQGKPFNITVIQVYALTTNAEEAEVDWFFEDLQDLPELTPQKRFPFHHGKLEGKSRKSRDTWSNRQVWPWSTKWSRAKTNGVLPREHTGHSKHPFPETQETTVHMEITRWSIPKSDWLYSLQPKLEKLYTVSENKIWSWVWLRSWTPYCQIQT